MSCEISGNLDNQQDGIPNYNAFSVTVNEVYNEIMNIFGYDIMSKYPLLIDNGTAHTGYTPIITPVWGYGFIIKLNIEDGMHRTRIIFQLSHELTHYVFFSLLGIDKERADDIEEMYCSAMSLIFLKEMCSDDDLESHKMILSECNNGYGSGIRFAEKINYNKELVKINLLNLVEQIKKIT